MPNAREAHEATKFKIITLGTTGAGKTSQFLTLPGKKFMYLFDPNALLSIQGHDIEYEEFLPDQINLDVKSLSKDNNKGRTKVMKSTSAERYTDWEKDFESKRDAGFFEDFDWIGMDSFTTLADMVMDQVLTVNGRPDQWPNQDDYGPQMLTLKNIVRTFASLGKNIYFTGHLEMKQDELTKRIYNTPVMTGRLKSSLPLLFSEIFPLEGSTDKDGQGVFLMQTKPTRDTPLVRTSIKGLELYEDVTINWEEEVEGQGLGGILNWWDRERRGLNEKKGGKAK